MRLLTILPLLAATFIPVLAKPLPISMDEYERRWSNGESEASIHSNHNIREATPAWPVVRSYADIEDNFAYATDERSMEMHRFGRSKRSQGGVKPSKSLMAKMKAFVKDFYRHRGEKSVVAKREPVVEVEEAPVLKPRRGYRYQFNA